MRSTVWTFGAALILCLVHLYAGRLHVLGRIPRSRWLSGAGGAAVAYVFLHILPDLAEHQRALRAQIGAVEHLVYLTALAGLATFYGLERAAVVSRGGRGGDEATPPSVFWLHVVSYGLYNVLVGYLLVAEREGDGLALVLYVFAVGLHFVVNDVGLREHHKHRYSRIGRWILVAAVLVGWALGTVEGVPPMVLWLSFAFLAGGIVLNVLKEELPEQRESRFWAFAAGLAGYALVLVLAGA